MSDFLIACGVAVFVNILCDRCIAHSKTLSGLCGKVARMRPRWLVWVGGLVVTIVVALVLYFLLRLFLSDNMASLLGIAVAMGLENPAFQRATARQESKS